VIGSPETVAARIAELEEAGVGEVACWMNFGGLPLDKIRRSMRLFAEDVMPRFRGVLLRHARQDTSGDRRRDGDARR
jgi:hypothetical protein